MLLLPSPILAATEEAVGSADPGIYGTLIPLLLLLPIAGFAFSALFGRRLQLSFGRWAAEIVPVGLIVLTWLVALAIIVPALQHAEPFGEHGLDITLWTWIPAGDFIVDIGFHVDALTACLLIVVTTIGMLVHVYSIGYMAHDAGTWRFFAYLNLFMFSMLLLVLANNWLLVFAGWELVGLSSYSLIGYWYSKRTRGAGRQEGVHRQPRRRRRVRARDHGDLREHRHAEHPGLDRDHDRQPGVDDRPDRARRRARVRRRDGQERPVPAPRLAAGRDGGPDPGLGPDPRRDDGQRGRLPRRAVEPPVRPRAGDDGGGRRDRHLHRDPRGLDRLHPDRHQARPRVLDAVAAGLHVRGPRRRRVHRRDLPPA